MAAVAAFAIVVLPGSIASAGSPKTAKPPSVATCTGMLGQETSLILTGCSGSAKITAYGLGIPNIMVTPSTAVITWTDKKYTDLSFTETATAVDNCPTLGGGLAPLSEVTEVAMVTGGNTKLTTDVNHTSNVCVYAITGSNVGDGDGVLETNLPGSTFSF
jgi:hypothetical protein